MISYKERLPAITTILFDVDGVLTNGEVTFSDGAIMRTLNAKDGYALQYAAKKGYRLIVITGATSEDIKHRLERVGVAKVMLHSTNKLAVYNELKTEFGFDNKEVLYMGDDIPDIPVLKIVGLSACPQDASPDVKNICHYQSPFNGGYGCVRDVIEQVMRVQGKWLNDDAYYW